MTGGGEGVNPLLANEQADCVPLFLKDLGDSDAGEKMAAGAAAGNQDGVLGPLFDGGLGLGVGILALGHELDLRCPAVFLIDHRQVIAREEHPLTVDIHEDTHDEAPCN